MQRRITTRAQDKRSRRRLIVAMVAFVLGGTACTGSGSEPPADDGASATTQAAEDLTPSPDELTDSSEATLEPDATSYAGTQPAPEFPDGYDWINSDQLSFEQLRGKVVLLDFWTYGCINCIHIIPELKRLEAEYPDELVVIGVHSAKFANESATENIRQIVRRYEVEHPVVNDGDFVIWRSWGVNAWPTSVLIDPAGNVVGGHSGEGVYAVTQPIIESLIAEFDANGTLDRTPIPLDLETDREANTQLSFPGKVHVEPGDNRIFIADTGHHRIVVTDRKGSVLGIYGSGAEGFENGSAAAATFASPQGMALDSDGTTLYVADVGNHAIRAIDTTSGEVRTLAGTGSQGWPPTAGVAPVVALNSPWDVLVFGDQLYIAMAGFHQLWSMSLASGDIAPLVGSAREGVLNGPFGDAELAQPSGLALSIDGRLYFADSESSSIRYADLALPVPETGLVAGGDEDLFSFGDADGIGSDARFQHPLGVEINPADGSLLIADTYNSLIRAIDPVSQDVTTLYGGEQGWSDGSEPQFYEPGGISVDGTTLYVADTNNHVIRTIDLTSGTASTLVLSGLEAFEPPPESEAYNGTIVTGEGVVVAAGTGQVVLDLALPAGYKINEDASSTVVFADTGVVTVAQRDSDTGDSNIADITGATLPVVLTVDYGADGDLVADLNLVYCAEEAESLCLFEQVRFVTPITLVDPNSTVTTTDTVALSHTIVIPDING